MNMSLLHANVPIELKAKPIWMGYRLVEKRPGEKPGKVPINPHNGEYGSSTDLSKQSDFMTAITNVERFKCDGIGFSFAPPYVGVDLDHCIVDGKINSFAQRIIDRLDSYTEISRSGDGVHIICKGSIPAATKTAEVEVYQTGRFFVTTGNRISRHSLVRQIGDFSFLYPEGEKGLYKPTNWLEKALEEMKMGNIDNTLMQILGKMRRENWSEEAAFLCLQPLALSRGATENHVREKIAGVWKRYQPQVQVTIESSHSLLEFVADYKEPIFVVPELIEENTINVIAGLPESRKSWVLLDLAIAIASNTEWLGRFPAAKGRVLIIDQERPKKEMQRRIQALAAAKGIPLKKLENQLVPKVKTPYELNSKESFGKFCELIEEIKPSVLMIDSLKTIQTDNVNDNQAMQKLFENFKILRNTYGLTIVILHHENKGAYQRKREGWGVTAENIEGAGAINQVPEGLFVTVPQDDESSLLYHVKNSFGTKTAPIAIKVEDLSPDKSKIKVTAF